MASINRTIRRAGRATLFGVVAFIAVGVATGSEVVALRAPHWIAPDGELRDDGLVVVRDGRILQVGGQPPAGARRIEFESGVLSPGLIDVHSGLAAAGRRNETSTAVEPAVRAADAFDPHRPELRVALAAGVTAIGLAPDERNLVGGRIAVCRTGGADGAAVLKVDGPLKLSLTPAIFEREREPTSAMGAIGMLRRHFEAGQEPALAELARGSVRGIVAAPGSADVLGLLILARSHDLKLAVWHMDDAARVARDVQHAGFAAVVGPYDSASALRVARAAAVFSEAGVPVLIAGGLPDGSPDALRLSAAVAVRAGLSKANARRAITSLPAEWLGVGDQIGSLERGRRADVVVFSGDPLDLRSRAVEVWIDGVRQRLD